ncbi:MAG: GTPase HflX [Candidatus Thorarchaeota archaeon]
MVESTALLVQRRKYRDPDLLEEFAALATTADYEIIGTFDIVSPPSSKFGIRSGKAEEIKTWIEVNKPDFALVSPRLKSSQIFRLMELWEIEVRDRSQVILEIFAKHAHTQQAQLQIEQARLKYELPFERHQIRMRLSKEHTGDRPVAEQVGAGEDLLNMKIKEQRRRIAAITQKLEKISESQALKKKKRVKEGFIEIALAGYTNAGKSTLHHALTDSGVEIADKLFTTLATKAAELDLPGRQIVISDSVGFISSLPTALLQAFNTTLMEVADADIIILVVDASDSIDEMNRKVDTCLDTFNEIGANGIPILSALNKIDLVDETAIEERMEFLREISAKIVPISAKTHVNIDGLIEALEQILPQLILYSITLPYGDDGMSILSRLHEEAIIESETYNEDSIIITARLNYEVFQTLERELNPGSIKKIIPD